MPQYSLIAERPQILRRQVETAVAGGFTFTAGPLAVSNFGRLTAVFRQDAGAPVAGYPRAILSVDGVSQDLIVAATQDTSQADVVYTLDVALTLPYVQIEYVNGATPANLAFLILAWPTPATTAGSGGGGGGTLVVTLAYLGTTPLQIGADLVNPTFNASYSASPASATLDDTDGNPAENVLGVANPLTMPYTYQETANGGTVVFTLTANGSVTDSDTVTWLPLSHWGVAAGTTLNAAQILALSGSELTADRATSFTLSPANEYVYYAWPTAYGAATGTSFSTPPPFTGGWIEMTGSPIAITAATAGAPVQNYYVWRTINPLTATNVLTEVT